MEYYIPAMKTFLGAQEAMGSDAVGQARGIHYSRKRAGYTSRPNPWEAVGLLQLSLSCSRNGKGACGVNTVQQSVRSGCAGQLSGTGHPQAL